MQRSAGSAGRAAGVEIFGLPAHEVPVEMDPGADFRFARVNPREARLGQFYRTQFAVAGHPRKLRRPCFCQNHRFRTLRFSGSSRPVRYAE